MERRRIISNSQRDALNERFFWAVDMTSGMKRSDASRLSFCGLSLWYIRRVYVYWECRQISLTQTGLSSSSFDGLRPLWPLLISDLISNYESYRQLIGFLGWGISPSQNRYLHRTAQTQKKTQMHIHV
jgi:hypothetical protein